MKTLDDFCFHCIDEGYLFCADNDTATTGKCVAAFCTEQEDLTGDAKKAAKGQCTLKNHACVSGIPMIHYSQCMPSYTPPNTEKCPGKITITKEDIEKGGNPFIDDTGNEAFVPFHKDITMDKMGVCVTSVSSDFVTGGWSLTEWDPSVYVMMTRLEDGAIWDETNSGMYHAETYYYNREAKDGNIVGRVPVKTNVEWQLLFLNYERDEEAYVKMEYGAAMDGFVASTLGLVAAACALLM